MVRRHRILLERNDAVSRFVPGEKDELSLMELTDGRVCFVHWIISRPGWAQLIRIDEKTHKIKMPIYTREHPEYLGETFLVHPRTHVQLVKDVTLREPVSEDMRTLKAMWLVGVDGGRVLQHPCCFVCDKTGPPLLSCPFCLTTSHDACLEELVAKVGSSEWRVPSLIDKVELQRWRPRSPSPGGHKIVACLWCWSYAVHW